MKRGTTILKCEPFCYIVREDKRPSVCDNCFAESADAEVPLKKCTRCKVARYCGVRCQKESWRDLHKEECTYLAAVAPKVPTDTARLMARAVIRLRGGGASKTVSCPGGVKRRFDDLVSHRKEIVRDSSRIEAFQAFFEVVKDCFGEFTPPKDEMLEIYGRILINSFNIMNVENLPIGIGLYLEGSVFDHSCEPNATVVFDGKKLIVRAIKELSEDETIYISYTSLHHPTAKRRAALREQYYFECGCSRCCDCEGDQLQNGERDDDALEAAFDLALEEERFEAAYDIGADILAAYEKFAPQFDPNTGVMLLKMGKLALYLDKFDECKTHLDKAKKVLLMTHGSDHRVVTDTLESLMQQFKGFSTMMTNGSGIKSLH